MQVYRQEQDPQKLVIQYLKERKTIFVTSKKIIKHYNINPNGYNAKLIAKTLREMEKQGLLKHWKNKIYEATDKLIKQL